MNILWLSWRDFKNPDSGGAEKVAIEIAKRLVHNNSSVTIFTSSFKKARPQERVNGVNIIREGNRFTCRLHAFLYYRENPNFDIVIDEVNTIPFLTPLYVKGGIICFIHQLARQYWFFHTPFPLGIIGYLLESFYLKLYTKIPTLTVSKSSKEDLNKLGFMDVKIIREGLEIKPKIPKTQKKDQIIFLGRLVKAKGPKDAIVTFAKIQKVLPDYKMFVIGLGNDMKKLKKLVKSLSLSQKVKFTGYVDDKTKIQLLKESKIILIPSVREGWGLVATEAMSQSCVPVAYNVPGLKDAIKNNQTGILTAPNPSSITISAIKLLQDAKLISKLAQNGHRYSQKFSWDNTYTDFKKALDDKLPKVSH